MPMDFSETNSKDCDPYWCKQLTEAVLTRQGQLRKISEEDRIERIHECVCEGVKIDTIDEDGNTALHLAVQKGYLKIVQFLVKRQAKTDIRNKNGDTALTLAKDPEKEDILKVLKEPANRGSQSPSHQTASTSRGTSSSDDRVYTSVDNRTVLENAGKSYKRKATTDNEDDENVKKQRFRTSNSGKDFQSQNETDDTKIDVLQNSSLVKGNNTRTYAARQGLKNSFHGDMYQVKLLMLFVKRGLRESYPFWLATEMDKAGKFDDLIFRYEIEPNIESKTVYRFLQAKHKQDETKKISATDLLTSKDDDFSLQKYFISYCEMKKDSELNGSTFEDFIICTNITFDYDTLRSTKIDLVEVTDHDVFLKFGVTRKTPKRYRFSIDEHSVLYEILRQTADIYRLAKILVEHVYKSKSITLKNDIFKLYHMALAKEVIDIEKKRFRANFVQGRNLSRTGEKFREIFHAEVEKTKLKKQRKDKFRLGNAIWDELRDKPLDISSRFGERFEPCNDPTLNHLAKFSEVFVELISNADNNNLVTVNGQKYRNDAAKESSRIFANNIEKLAGHVLIINDEEIIFNPDFFYQTTLPGNLKNLRNQLKARLGIKYEDLDKYRFKMPGSFQTCEIELLYGKHELPGNEVDNEEIDDFITKLIFAVNQPDENELGDILIKEIGADSQFNLLDADLLGTVFEKEILDWFKKKGKVKGEEGTWYSNENAQDFFDSLELKVNTLVCMGLSSPYTKELNDYDINFATENKYLMDYLTHDTSKLVLNLIATGETLPTAIRVHQAILKSGRYDGNDSLLFLRHGTAMSHSRKIRLAFTSPDCHHLLVIDCESAEMSGLHGLYEELYQTILKNPFKKLIFITLGTGFSVKVESIPLEICWNDLTAESQNQLMRKDVINFQGQRRSTSFGRLLGIRDWDENVATELKNFGVLIDTSTLVKLIRGVDIEVGTDLRGLEETEKYYIPRRIKQQVIVKHDALQSDLGSDLVAISVAASGSSVRLISRVERVRFEDIDPREQDLHGLIILDPEQETEQFETLCNNSVRNVHLLKIMGKKLIWQRTRGNVTALVKYRIVSEGRSSSDDDFDKITTTTWTEDQLIDHIEGQKVVIISDGPGMGKSTVFTHLAQMIKQKKPDVRWVIRVDLNDYTYELNEERKSRSFDGTDTDGAVEFFVNKLSKLETDFQKNVLKTMIKNRNEVALLFDGFDEISPGYTNPVIDLLQGLEKIGTAKLLISTRPHMREILEKKLGTFAYTMEPFIEENQIEFLVRFWKAKLSLNGQEQRIVQRLETYAKALTKQMAKSVDGWIEELAGIPLPLLMIAEIFQNSKEGYMVKTGMETCEEFLISNNDQPEFRQKIEIGNLYKLFIEKKFYIYSTEKKKDEPTNLGVEDDNEELRKAFIERHEKLALHMLFDDKFFPDNSEEPVLPLLLNRHERNDMHKNLEKVKLGRERTGIVNQVINDRSQFTHRTFAEYFVASFIINTLLTRVKHTNARKFVLEQILINSNNQYKVIRDFFNGLLPEEPEWSDESVLEAWKLDVEASRNPEGDTIFHEVAKKGNFKIVKLFLNLFDQDVDKRKYWINLPDHFPGQTLVHIAARKQHWEEMKWLIEKGGVGVNTPDRDGSITPLYVAVSHGDLETVKWLVETEILHVKTGTEKSACSFSLDSMKWFSEKKVSNLQDENYHDSIVQDIVDDQRLWEMVKHIKRVYDADVRTKNDMGRTALLFAIRFGRQDIIEWLVNDRKIDVNGKFNSKYSIIQYAVIFGYLPVVEFLIVDKSADIKTVDSKGNTLQHVALWSKSFDVFKWLMNKQDAGVEVKNNDGETLLHYAAMYGESLTTMMVRPANITPGILGLIQMVRFSNS